ncbi:unnamed protein product, partial [Ixodes pacificus]
MKPHVAPLYSTRTEPIAKHQDPTVEALSEDRILSDDGPFQWMVLGCSSLVTVVNACHAFSLTLAAFVMNHWCLPPDDIGNLTLDEWKTASIPIEEDGSFSQCTMYDPQSLPKNDSIKKIISCTAWSFNLTEHGETIVSEWSLVCDRRWLIPVASLVYYSGTIIGLPILGMVSDRIGRRPVACACVGVLIITGFACTFSKSFLFFTVVRFAVSVSAGSLMTVLFVVIYEVCAPAKRVLYGTLTSASAFVVTPFIFIAMSILQLDWMVIHLVFMVPTSFLVATFYLVQESPRWLLATWKLKAAERVTLLAAKVNRTSLDIVRHSFNSAVKRIRASDFEEEVPVTITLMGLLQQSKHRKNAMLLFCTWITVNFAYSAIATRKRMLSYQWVPLVSVASTAPFLAGLYVCLEYYGRKKVTFVLTILVSIEATVLMFTYHEGSPTLVAAVVIVFLEMSSIAAFTALLLLTLELFPTVFRSMGVATSFACGSLGTVLATMLNEVEATTVREKVLLAVIAVLTMIGAFTIHFLPDTGGPVLFTSSKKAADKVDAKYALAASLEPHSTDPRRSAMLDKHHPRRSIPSLTPGLLLRPFKPVPPSALDLSQAKHISSKPEAQE